MAQKNENENKQDNKRTYIYTYIHNTMLIKIHIIPCIGKFPLFRCYDHNNPE